MLQVQRVSCVSCGAAISVPPDVDYLNCGHCGTSLRVVRGDGYIASKLAEQVGRSIEASGAATVDELRRAQRHQEMLMLRQQIVSLEAEERTYRLHGRDPAAQPQILAVERQWNSAVRRLTRVEQELGLQPSYVRDSSPPVRPFRQRLGAGIGLLGFVILLLGAVNSELALVIIGLLFVGVGVVAARGVSRW